MTRQKRNDECEDDDDVIYTIDAPSTLSEEIIEQCGTSLNFEKSTKAIAIQTIAGPLLTLRVLPTIKDSFGKKDLNSANINGLSKIWKYLRFLARLSLSLFGLLWLLAVWTVIGAVAFCAMEGARECEEIVELKNMQKNLALSLATELTELRAEKGSDIEPFWSDKVGQYISKHEELLVLAINSGYGEGDAGQLWTFCGSILFALSILTTLGFGAPVPRTTAGRIVAIIFAAIGIPAHFLLIMNAGLLIAVRLQRYAIGRKYMEYDKMDPNNLPPVPRWVKIVPFFCIASYYLLGISCFGISRSRPIAASLLFPLDFTAAGGLATINGYVRILYGLYLEGAVTIAAVAVAVLRVSATQSLTNIGIKYDLLTEV